MRSICLILTQSLESPGGTGRFLPLAKALSSRGYKIKILALHHDFHNLLAQESVIDNVEVKYVAQMHVLKRNDTKTYYGTFKLLGIVLNAIISLSYNALQTDADGFMICKAQPMNLIAGWVAKVLKRKPLFMDADDFETLNNRYTHQWQQHLVATFERLAYKTCDSIFVSNTYLYNYAIRLGVSSNKIELVPHGYDINRFAELHSPGSANKIQLLREAYRISPEDKVVLFCGSLSLLSHAIDILIDAFKEVLLVVNNVILVIVGRGEDFQRLQELVKQAGISEFVRFPGFIEPAEIPYFYKLSYFSCDPKRGGELEQSTLSLKLIESIASGTPCITADVGDSKLILNGAGFAVEPGSPSAMATAMISLLQDENLHQDMVNRALIIRRELSWDSRIIPIIKRFQEFLQ